MNSIEIEVDQFRCLDRMVTSASPDMSQDVSDRLIDEWVDAAAAVATAPAADYNAVATKLVVLAQMIAAGGMGARERLMAHAIVWDLKILSVTGRRERAISLTVLPNAVPLSPQRQAD